MGSIVRGLYFIRFAIAMWIFPLAISLADWLTPAATFTRGIMTPESPGQAITASFMLISSGVIALLNLRLVAINGRERFVCDLNDNDWLARNMGKHELPTWLFILAHAPALCAIAYIEYNICRESAPVLGWPCLGAGIVVAYLFWLIVGLIYLWTFDENELGKRLPVRLIFPDALIPMNKASLQCIVSEPPPLLANWLRPFFRFIAHTGGPGFASDQKTLYEGHRLAAMSICGLLIIYVYLFAFTAPLDWPAADTTCSLIAALVIVIAAFGSGLGRWPVTAAARVVKVAATLLFISLAAVVVTIWIGKVHDSRSFSVLGSVLILDIGAFWILSAVAFAFDRARFPVLSGSVFILMAIKLVTPTEHYFTVLEQPEPYTSAPSPEEVLASFMKRTQSTTGANHPAIVITAEGGGIHSAAWTANVLMELEQQFAKINPSNPFHKNILLVSTVSGGSVGLLPFLREYGAPHPFAGISGNGDLPLDRVTESAACSSLQAVTWGLTYYDALSLLQPVSLFRPADGIEPLRGYDRSWALEAAIRRNLTDTECLDRRMSPLILDNEHDVRTLHQAADKLRSGDIPAFVFNTTVVETGARFLLSNYELPAPSTVNSFLSANQTPAGRGDEKIQTDIIPAESFLHAFAHENGDVHLAPGIRHGYADLPLTTAARLSATFPYVSSASRIPKRISDSGYHFVDGGYFDNDGTSSAIEFLKFALDGCPAAMATEQNHEPPNKTCTTEAHAGKVPILFIEIRNDSDLNTSESRESFASQNGLERSPKSNDATWTKPARRLPLWGAVNQLTAPFEGFWNAGHDSDTLRNRRELCMFERAYADRVAIHHMVFDYRNREDTSQPLSWDLTPNQRNNIRCAVNPHFDGCRHVGAEQNETPGTTIEELAETAARWFQNPDIRESDGTCASWGLGMR